MKRKWTPPAPVVMKMTQVKFDLTCPKGHKGPEGVSPTQYSKFEKCHCGEKRIATEMKRV